MYVILFRFFVQRNVELPPVCAEYLPLSAAQGIHVGKYFVRIPVLPFKVQQVCGQLVVKPLAGIVAYDDFGRVLSRRRSVLRRGGRSSSVGLGAEAAW